MYTLSAISINHTFFRIISSKIDTFQIFNCFFLTKFKNFISTSACIDHNYVVKLVEPVSVYTNEERRPTLEKDLLNCFSEMSFYISTGDRNTSGDNGVIPVSNNMRTLRRYEFLKAGNEFDVVNPDIGVPIRVMNYNVLSQALLEEHHYLYKQQSPRVLAWNFRSPLILAEILAVNPDVLCLQEVEELHIPTFYKSLESYGYQAVTKMKTGRKRDGLAIFYRVPEIKLIETENVEYRQPGVIQLASRDNVGLIAKLEKEGKQFIVANTHLLYNPKRTEVRLAQLQLFLAEIDRIARRHSDSIGVLLMGDLNSTPESPVITLLNDGKLLSTYRPLPPCLGVSPKCVHMQQESKLYHSQKQFGAPCEGKEELIPVNLPSAALNQSYLLSHHFKFSSAYNLADNENRGVTTFQHEWVLVDYIFYTNGFELMSRLSLPTAAECYSFVNFLPNDVNPSDHLPLVADFLIY